MIVDSRIVIESAMLISAFKSVVQIFQGTGPDLPRELWSRSSKGRVFILEKIGDNYEIQVAAKPAPKVKAKPKAAPKPKSVAKVRARASLKRVLEEDDPMDCR